MFRIEQSETFNGLIDVIGLVVQVVVAGPFYNEEVFLSGR